MSTDRWRQIERVYHAALERAAGDRAAFVAAECGGDTELQREVLSLLEHSSTPGFLSTPAIEVAAALVEPSHWIGRRIGAYEVQALLGRGGMGEVYRARDARLGRDVAIKVLPKAFTANPDRLARFDREARVLASLSHPHIGTIHGVEEGDGVFALVLELVEGDTLADRVRRGPVPVREALGIARQIADALDAAHEKGIVHRDLKPANIKITPDGVVKVLDFGLAKTAASTPSGLGQPPTVTADGTEDGVILGTAAYMSPEQARGQTVDKRADVWAFGCVLFELLTGRAVFAAPTSSDTIAAILHREPDWTALPATLPASVTTLLSRCLEKDARRRKREMGDARAELDDALTQRRAPDARPADVVTPSRPRAALPWTIAAAAIVLAIGALTFATWPRWQNPIADAQFIQLTSFPGSEEGAAISPEGRWVAFLSDQSGTFHPWVTPLGPGGFTDLTPNDDDQRLNRAGSPDLGFTGDGQQIWLGGSPGRTRRLQTVSLMSGGPRGPFLNENVSTVSWSPDGRRIVYNSNISGDPLFVANRDGTEPIQIMQSATGLHNHGPVWSTDGEFIYFLHGHPDVEMDVWRVRPQKGAEPEALTGRAYISSLTPIDRDTVLYTGRAEDGMGPWLWALDVKTKASHRVSSGLEQYTSVSASADGRTIVASRSAPHASLWTVPILDRPAEPRDVQPFGPPGVRALSPRASGTATYFLSAFGTGDGLWRFQDGQSTELWRGSQGALLEPAAISRDRLHAAVLLRKNSRRTLTIVDTDGSGTSHTLAESIDVHGTADWSPDGRWIVVSGEMQTGAKPAGLFRIPTDGSPPVLIVPGKVSDPAGDPVVSPDGSLIVYVGSDVGGVSTLMAVHENGAPIDLSTRANGVIGNHRFLPDGSGVVFVRGPLRTPEFWRLDLATKKATELTHISTGGSLGDIRGFDVTADGRHIIFDRVSENSDIVLIKRPSR